MFLKVSISIFKLRAQATIGLLTELSSNLFQRHPSGVGPPGLETTLGLDTGPRRGFKDPSAFQGVSRL
jgi:hypothetical protein